ncbi:hypothetical protein B7P43_G08429 [Cryptotermes secundus]|uniref:Uncharacterized protein n=1 Tax=Cryptotermes secundus TaxID=105785 RepID=A0A2J7QNP2_9NEOP|nr:hypothetical protein B7P43_G08429 [Cryptotermes secundus]
MTVHESFEECSNEEMSKLDLQHYSLLDVMLCSLVDRCQYFNRTCCTIIYPEDGGSRFHQNVGAYLCNYMVSLHEDSLDTHHCEKLNLTNYSLWTTMNINMEENVKFYKFLGQWLSQYSVHRDIYCNMYIRR